MKFALVHFRAGETDGVSLEMEKWEKSLANLGHKSFILAGSGAGNSRIFDFRHPRIKKFTSNCFAKLEVPQVKLEEEFNLLVAICQRNLEAILRKEKPDFLIVNNVFSLPLNIPFAAALSNVKKKYPGKKVIGFHHDFYWERTIYNPTCLAAKKYLSRYFPPKNIDRHITINSLAKRQLIKKKKIKSFIFQNYFDFSQINPSKISNLRRELKIAKDSVVFLHATRIVERKAIELAIDSLEKIKEELTRFSGKNLYNGKKISKNTKVYLLFPGLIEEKNYYLKIKERLKNSPLKSIFCEKLCRRYSFWDFYHAADAVTYTSVKEGWGNQLIEALALKKPVLIFEYPVFRSDIKKFGFKLVSLGSRFYPARKLRKVPASKINKAAEKMLEILANKKLYRQTTEHNYKIAARRLSILALQKDINRFLKNR